MSSFFSLVVTVDQWNNQIVVADTWNNRIQIFDEKGPFFAFLGRRVKDNSVIHTVSLLTSRGNYVVADSDHHRIQIFNSEGQFVRKFGSS